MHLASAVNGGIPQCLQIECVVLRLEKDSLPVDAACNHMLRDVREKVSRLAGHSPSVIGAISPVDAQKCGSTLFIMARILQHTE
jgi:hypothetical protein